MNSKPYLAFAFSLLLTSSAFAGQQEEIDKAMKMYGDEARTIMNDAEDALKKGIPEVEDYFNNPGEVKKPQESFFGFGQKRVPEPSIDPSKSCGNCRSQSIEFLGKPSEKKKTASQGVSALTPSSFSKEVIVFVSLGMPDNSLKQLAIEAEKTKARLVIRGLLDNSFKTTMTRLQELKIPVEIDPTLFELFEVERVPTFVQCRVNTEGAVKAGHDRISGNIFISDAIEKFDRFGESA
jgi:type-F conjugative transfer system pilin assembly protein TrbC